MTIFENTLATRCDEHAGNSPHPFSAHITPLPERTPLRTAITHAWRRPETVALPALVDAATLPGAMVGRIDSRARSLVEQLRVRSGVSARSGLVQGLLQEFSLSSREGVALMCLAEALLRIPDTRTRDALIRDKVSGCNWQGHVGQSQSMFVNAAAWGLMVTGKLVAPRADAGLGSILGRVVARGGEPLIRKAVDVAMRMMGEQFVTGQTIDEALRNARPMEAKGFSYSYDMLGEAAVTAEDAARYLADYEQAIHAIGKHANQRGVLDGPGISIKLSALHPRYYRAQIERVMAELYPVLKGLAALAHHYDIGLNIDAEEADRLELSLDLFEQLCHEPELAGWDGLGFVVQAYQKRCPYVIDYLIDLARRSQRRLMIRLVKGAYWDTEIKLAQLAGLDDYPVYTRKAYTDVSFIACARKLLAATDAVYPQFATHNAHTLATIYEMADPAAWHHGQYEFQCLHGMGETLYEHVVNDASGAGRPCRIYAPVGTHDTLLAYLVRRLLENGANSSFVNQIADKSVPIDQLIKSPIEQVISWTAQEGRMGLPHPRIPAPSQLYGSCRRNSRGLDLANEQVLAQLANELHTHALSAHDSCPILADGPVAGQLEDMPVHNPADHTDVVGTVRHASPAEIEDAIRAAAHCAPTWADKTPSDRADMLLATASHMEREQTLLISLLIREAGKTYANAMSEVREAIDFLRYYSAQVRQTFHNASHLPLGPVTCISPWNFPLAIFSGQIAAALAAGNTVLAKPAEQTPLIAAAAVRLFHKGGIPGGALQLLPGRGREVGPLITGDERIQGVMFTGSTAVAKGLQQVLAKRLSPSGKPIPLVAETGGQNAMIVDSSALAEQVVHDVIMSAFDSTGQRCSALRVLYLQDDVAERLIEMIKGAMRQLRVGNPALLATDIGPVIDARARDGLHAHIDAMRARGKPVHQFANNIDELENAIAGKGSYVLPTLIELDSIAELSGEVFGPVLHVIRYPREKLHDILADIRSTGYGLTMGMHTRIDDTIRQIIDRAHAGNLYVNRNMVGAVVGVQPFGGHGLSGTGPKAGGPLYLYRLLSRRPEGIATPPFGVQGIAFDDTPAYHQAKSNLEQLAQWCAQHKLPLHDTELCQPLLKSFTLAGPTGEQNLYELLPVQAVLCVAVHASDLVTQLAGVLAVGSRAIWDGSNPMAAGLHAELPDTLRKHVHLADDWLQTDFDVAIHHGDSACLRRLLTGLAQREGILVPVIGMQPGEYPVPLERLVLERAISTNTAAAGGNTTLMSIA